MYIRSSYRGTTVGRERYLFFVLYEDYNDLGRSFIREFDDVYVSRLARRLGDGGAVVTAFPADIETARAHVLEKEWTPVELAEVKKVPSLLVIDVDFDDFSPRTDPWLLLHFGERAYGGSQGLDELRDTIEAIADAAIAGDPDELFAVARAMTQAHPDLTKVFEARPGMFGFSINLIEAGAQLRDWLRDRRTGSGDFTAA
jgi:hypothetical protein